MSLKSFKTFSSDVIKSPTKNLKFERNSKFLNSDCDKTMKTHSIKLILEKNNVQGKVFRELFTELTQLA